MNEIERYVLSQEIASGIREDDRRFLLDNSAWLRSVMANTYIWRTDGQKESIISDHKHPTAHSKFHQAILEQKVQLDGLFSLLRDFEKKKVEIELLRCDLEEHDAGTRRGGLERQKTKIDITFGEYELAQMEIAISYRMREVKGWKKIQDRLYGEMKNNGRTEEEIWSKEADEIRDGFYIHLTKLCALGRTTDAGEVNNLLSLATHYVKQAKEAGIYEECASRCTEQQKAALATVENMVKMIG